MTPGRNQLIERLPRTDRQRLLAQCETVALEQAALLCEQGRRSSHAYFPTEGFISLVTQTSGHPGLEVGLVGPEGMLGAELALGVPLAPWRGLVQGQGMALRIGRMALRRELARSKAVQNTLHRHLYVLMTQLAATAACVRFHLIGPRLARWLLTSQDRAQTDHFHITHETLSSMLGVRRVGITMAAGDLQRNGLISYHRGELTVLDRPGLEATACSCYGQDQRRFDEVMHRD